MAPKLCTCPKCRKAHLGHDPLPDWRAGGFDYREREGFRMDMSGHLLSILGLVSFPLVVSFYRSLFSGTLSCALPRTDCDGSKRLPGSERATTFHARIMM